MTAQPVQVPTVAPVAPVFNTAGASDTIAVQPTSKYLLHIKNANAGTVSVVITDPNSQSPAGATAYNASVTISIPTGTERLIVLDSGRFRDVNGNITLTFTPNASVTYAIYQIQ